MCARWRGTAAALARSPIAMAPRDRQGQGQKRVWSGSRRLDLGAQRYRRSSPAAGPLHAGGAAAGEPCGSPVAASTLPRSQRAAALAAACWRVGRGISEVMAGVFRLVRCGLLLASTASSAHGWSGKAIPSPGCGKEPLVDPSVNLGQYLVSTHAIPQHTLNDFARMYGQAGTESLLAIAGLRGRRLGPWRAAAASEHVRQAHAASPGAGAAWLDTGQL